ncbi:hypothetical protein [Flavobacterium sp.]|jgi:hypothetical protein|uniref:DUF6630 family protein n=1 Tax=Flavobacterium sp. TaxID=239 RepID=UPI0037BEBA73
MKKFFSKLFKNKSTENQSLLSFEVLNEIYSYLYYENPTVNFKLKGFFDKIYINRYNFPESFDNPKSKSEIKSCGFTTIYDVLNELYAKINIEPVSKELIDENYPVDFIHIQFYSEIIGVNSTSKNILQNFIFFFCCEEGSSETNGFRLLYSNNRYFTFFIRNLLDTKFIENNIPQNDIEEKAFKDFETVLIGICHYLKIELPETISATNLLPEEVTQNHFEELLILITRHKIDEKVIKKQAKKMFGKYKKPSEDDSFFEDNYKFLENVDCWNSDWKFDPEDAAYFISEMIEQDFTFEYPDETYSHDLFPYIQKELAKLELELMSFDTQGDNYLFFVANKNEVSQIIELAQIIDVKIDRL